MSLYLTVCVSVVPEAGGRKSLAEERPSKCLAEESSSVTVYLVSHVSVYVVATVCISLCQRYVSVYVSAMSSLLYVSRDLLLSASAKGALGTNSIGCMPCMHLCERRSRHVL